MSPTTSPQAAASEQVRRAEVLSGLHLGEGVVEERFDRIVRLAARLIGVPMAMINLVGGHQWTKAAHGIGTDPASWEDSICRRTVEGGTLLEVPDMTTDERFRSNRFVTQDPRVRFYAGQPLVVHGTAIGALCVLDTSPRALSQDQRELLAELASWAQVELGNAELNRLAVRATSQEHRLRSLLDAMPEGVLLVRDDGRVTLENTAAERLFGAPGGDRTVSDVLPGCVMAAATGTTADPIGPRREQCTATAPDGRTFPVEMTVTDVVDGDARWLVLVRDLRPTVDVDARLQTQERLTRLLLSSAGDGIVGIDRDGVVVFANRAATRLLRCQEEDLVGHRLHDVAHHTRPDGTPFPVEECPSHTAIVQGQTLPPYEDAYWRTDGSLVPIEMGVAPIVVDGQVQGAVSTFRDVSERQEVDRLKADFVGVVSHELRTPLAAIMGSLRLLDAGVLGPVPPAHERMLSMALTNAQRLSALVDDILDLNRLDAGRMPLDPVRTPAKALAQQVAEALSATAQESGIDLTTDIRSQVDVHVDPHRMGQALTNLVGNALKFTEAGGSVTIHVSRATAAGGDEARITVQDTGRGIPPDRLDAIFERFTQAGTGHQGERRGTGLGLSIAQGIVDRSGGHIEVTSEIGSGSTFTIVLPACATTPGGSRG